MFTRHNLATWSILLLLSSFVPVGAAMARGGTSRGEGTVVATGLANPRGVAVADDGRLYVAEAGLGGDEKITAPAPFGPSKRGNSGRVTRVAPDGTKTTVASGLPSTALGGFEVVGPAGLASANGALWLANGVTDRGIPPRANEAAVLRIDPNGGTVSRVTSFTAFERSQNPDGLGIESDPFGVDAGGNGSLYVADAGGNSLYRVNPNTGRFSLVTVFDGLPGMAPNPGRNGKKELDPVPTSVATDAMGNVYVGFLSGFPFPNGAAKVVRVSSDGTVSDAVTGLTGVVDVEVGPDGQLYAVEFGADYDSKAQPPGWPENSGRVLRILADGTKQVAVSGVNKPNGIAFDGDGNLFVAVNSDTPPQAGPQGQVLRFDGVAATTGMPGAGAGGMAGARTPAPAVAFLSLLLLAGGAVVRRRRRA